MTYFQQLLRFVALPIIVCSCVVDHQGVKTLQHFLTGIYGEDIGVIGSRADSLFEYKCPFLDSEEPILVYLSQASCSICIGKAIDCCNAFVDAGAGMDMVVLLQGSELDTFKYYFQKERRLINNKHIRLQLVTSLKDLPEGLFLIENKRVKNYSRWTEL